MTGTLLLTWLIIMTFLTVLAMKPAPVIKARAKRR